MKDVPLVLSYVFLFAFTMEMLEKITSAIFIMHFLGYAHLSFVLLVGL